MSVCTYVYIFFFSCFYLYICVCLHMFIRVHTHTKKLRMLCTSNNTIKILIVLILMLITYSFKFILSPRVRVVSSPRGGFRGFAPHRSYLIGGCLLSLSHSHCRGLAQLRGVQNAGESVTSSRGCDKSPPRGGIRRGSSTLVLRCQSTCTSVVVRSARGQITPCCTPAVPPGYCWGYWPVWPLSSVLR